MMTNRMLFLAFSTINRNTGSHVSRLLETRHENTFHTSGGGGVYMTRQSMVRNRPENKCVCVCVCVCVFSDSPFPQPDEGYGIRRIGREGERKDLAGLIPTRQGSSSWSEKNQAMLSRSLSLSLSLSLPLLPIQLRHD
ncbi:uncharacterized protein BO97DRAFT_185294 [Aspergillus homomorphus CBS 101889]|uniref:Uncharacterized protein n=1 Tax=Aspergillus homomorphus (strain CBS 101889) TaxID=1450537 RepID=A0A395HN14_ASPHC|nr:hypothetical protein BO97DRAFT_185294 [Aspergillus homomorphus CBS 101889]RAL09150.1 hypothetical protein BO97DRAFT_185294 [Aspergillus homomorphus CBS 101889]